MNTDEAATTNFIRPCLRCGTTVHVVGSFQQDHDCDPPANRAELVARAWWNGWDAKTPEPPESSLRPVVGSGASSAPLAAIEVLRELAENRLYDGDADQPLPGYLELLDLTDAVAAALAAERRRADEAEARIARVEALLAERQSHADETNRLFHFDESTRGGMIPAVLTGDELRAALDPEADR